MQINPGAQRRIKTMKKKKKLEQIVVGETIAARLRRVAHMDRIVEDRGAK